MHRFVNKKFRGFKTDIEETTLCFIVGEFPGSKSLWESCFVVVG